ncbi:SGNH/GDSL hydrolase family protein [Actinoplanes sp. LDG1-06]|uniref:SGNH/GDSL hydrolase family protein n=1 Tax=Paractinoplanes ovalisporus TaxID=2810368 RepID=A0ABS2ATU2_9ACTN|nr:SGNH/GDSL hydrolase family protein [Actinoplanes ovalisporus]MBM2623277.1 SGNH/GDSL hydrolase family protein [Actinoplanes ovalisporus]
MPTVVTLGDSVPAGTACGCTPFPALYAAEVHAHDVNLAIPGSTASDVRGNLSSESSELASASEVVIMTGANDMAAVFGQPARYSTVAAAVEDDVVATVAAIERVHRMPVVLVGYWNVMVDGQVAVSKYGADGVRDAARATDLVNDALSAAATRSGAVFVPTGAAFHGDGGEDDPTGLLAPDGDHPNAAGHAAIAAMLYARVPHI